MQELHTAGKLSVSALSGYMLAILGALIVLLSGYGYQWNLWGLGTAFRIVIPAGGLLAVLGLAASLWGLYRGFRASGGGGRSLTYAGTGVLFGLLTIGTIGYWYHEAQKYPPIHDISTDTQNPPAFRAIVPLRADAPNPVAYAGEETAALQREHYPGLRTLKLALPYAAAFDRALQAAEAMPWQLVDRSREEGRIEAFHRLAWYGFIDDVVIRVDSLGTDSSKIDIRSKSRIGRGDLGVNAWRINEYIKEIEKY